MLQAVNRYEPLLAHFADVGRSSHPEAAVPGSASSAAGELATFTATSKRPPKFPGYRHERLREIVRPGDRRAARVDEQGAGAERDSDSDRAAAVRHQRRDRRRIDRCYGSAVFILAARADLPSEELRRRFPAQLKIGPAEKIGDLVRLRLPGVPVHAVPVAPRQIPYHAGFAYFELDQSHEMWDQLKDSGGIAMHVAGEFPGLALEFWAIRELSWGSGMANSDDPFLQPDATQSPAAPGRGQADVRSTRCGRARARTDRSPTRRRSPTRCARRSASV